MKVPRGPRVLVRLAPILLGWVTISLAQTPFSDVFSETNLNAGWTLEAPNPDSTYAWTGTQLQISASWDAGGSDLSSGTDYNASRLLQSVNPSLDWVIETGFTFAPTDNYQGAGLLLAVTNGAFTNDSQFNRISERAFYPDAGGGVIRSEGSYVSDISGESFLRVEKEGTNVVGWFSADGTNWIYNGAGDLAQSYPYFGLFVIRYPWDGAEVDSVAGFNYFKATVLSPLSAEANYIPVSLASVANATNTRILNCPSGPQVFNGVAFNLLPPSTNNCWDAIGNTQPGDSSTQAMNLPVHIYGATAVSLLINLSWGTPGKVVPLTLSCSDGTSYTFALSAGAELRDWLDGDYVNTLDDGVIASTAFNGVSLADTNQPARVDMQTIPLPASFATKTLTNINLTDEGVTGSSDSSYSQSVGAQRAFVLGVTVATGPVWLNISAAPGAAILSWSTNDAAYELQTCTNLGNNSWTNLDATLVLAGGQFFVTNASTNASQYFRLALSTQGPPSLPQVIYWTNIFTAAFATNVTANTPSATSFPLAFEACDATWDLTWMATNTITLTNQGGTPATVLTNGSKIDAGSWRWVAEQGSNDIGAEPLFAIAIDCSSNISVSITQPADSEDGLITLEAGNSSSNTPIAPLSVLTNGVFILSAQLVAPLGDYQGYYADSVYGNDNNNGLTPFTAAQTLTRLTALDAASPQNTWNLARGSYWQGELDLPRSEMTVQAYGPGSVPPIIDCAVAIPSNAWSLTTGETYQAIVNVHQTTVTWMSLWTNGARCLNHATSLANCEATPGSYWPTYETQGTPAFYYVTLYVNFGGLDPGAQTNGFVEYSKYFWGLESDANFGNEVIKGIWTMRNGHTSGSLVIQGTNCEILNCRASQGNKHNAQIGDGVVSNCYIDEAYYANLGAGLFEYYEPQTINTPTVSFYNVTCTMSNYLGINNYGSFGGHTGYATNYFGAITISNCVCSNLSAAFIAGDLIYNCVGYGMDYGPGVYNNGYSNDVISGCVFNMNPANSAVIPIEIFNPGITLNVSNTSFITTSNSISQTVFIKASDCVVGLYNCYVTNCKNLIGSDGSNAMTSLSNTVYAAPGGGSLYYLQPNDFLTCDYNSYYCPNNWAVSNNIFWLNLDMWQTNNQDIHSTLIPVDIAWDFGAYPAGAQPATITNCSSNYPLFALQTNGVGLNLTGYSASFSGGSSNTAQLPGTMIGLDATYIAIARASNAVASQRDIVAGQEYSTELYVGNNGTPNEYFNGGTLSTFSTSNTFAADGNFRFIAGTINQTAGARIYQGSCGSINCTGTNATIPTYSVPNSSWVTGLTVGYRGDGNFYWDGDIAQIIIFNHTATSNELYNIYTNWQTIDAGRGITVQ